MMQTKDKKIEELEREIVKLKTENKLKEESSKHGVDLAVYAILLPCASMYFLPEWMGAAWVVSAVVYYLWRKNS